MNQPATAQTQVAEAVAQALDTLPDMGSDFAALLKKPADLGGFEITDEVIDRAERLGKLMATGRTTVPAHLREKPGDCAAIAMLALRLGCDPWQLASRSYFVNDKLSLEAVAIIAILNASSELATMLVFEWFGDWRGINGKDNVDPSLGVRVSAFRSGEEKPCVLELTMAEVGKTRNSPLWGYNPRQQIAYRGASYWGRLFAPNATMGIASREEMQDMEPVVTADPAILKGHRTASVSQLLNGQQASDAAAAAKQQDTPAQLPPQAAAVVQQMEAAVQQGYAAVSKIWKGTPQAVRDLVPTALSSRISADAKAADEARAARAKAKPDANGEIKTTPAAAGNAPSAEFAEYREAIKIASSRDDAAMYLDQARTKFGALSDEYKQLGDAFKAAWDK